ncbi:polysaccharide biosynthesis tyrosine autokinase [Xanthobacter dioxanivorans]|uniref:non-specific protein-tyrosine kinase n=1 Tax=Xanthobacter dioxanivorans TaxID=2528964 RepID=A0A974PLQ1_9HYPH|nr:polysaccharide biosynthesis tyrosine autokinase [Xanthobacter dioxanivorans]QRG05910.1 polysaccharide biosynthesis tyrosine autokinase [Xanthobacter dioxanivorans]
MLRIDKSTADTSLRLPGEADINISFLLQVLRRQRWVIAGVTAVFAGLATLYCLLATPQYTASAELLIDTQQNRGLDILPQLGGVLDSGMVDSQVQILMSERIAKAVIKELKLVEQAKEEMSKREGSFLSRTLGVVLPFLFKSDVASDYELERRQISTFLRELKVKRVGPSYVISIDFRSPNATHAADVANQVAEAYIVDQLESKYQATRRASVWLQDRINELRDQALSADRAVQDFKAKNNIIDTARGLVSDQQLSELNTQLVTARTSVAEAQARYDRVASIVKQGGINGTSDEVVSDVLNNEVISKLRSQYLDAVKREAEWSKRYGPDHIAVINLGSEIKGLQRALFNELSRIAETYKSDLEISKARENSLSKSLEGLVTQAKVTGQAQVELRELESNAQSYRALYDNFLQRFMQATQQQSFPITEARVITDASAPLAPSQPRTPLIVSAGTIIGLLAGFGVGVWRERMNRSFRLPADVERYLGLDCLGVLPLVPGIAQLPGGQSAFDSSVGIFRQVITDPFSRFAETLRSVKVSADVSIFGQSVRVIGIVSTLPKEGKSTVSANLAQLVAHSGQRCILIDGDLRNPSLTWRIAPNAKKGLLELVLGQATFDEVAIIDPLTNVKFIPAVVPSEIAHTNEILASDKMAALIDQLRQTTDYLVIDFPPMAPVVDVMASTHLVDGYVYVLDWGSSHRDLVINTLQNAPKVYEKVLGCLLNKVDIKAMKNLEDYGTKYYYHKYYASYGRDR